MKLIRAYFVMLYVQVILQLSIVPSIKYFPENKSFNLFIFLHVFALISVFCITQILGCLSASLAVKMYWHSEDDKIRKALILLKIKTVPFYLLNLVYGLIYTLFITFVSMGMALVLIVPVMIPIWYTCAFVVQSGFFGAAAVARLRKNYGNCISKRNYVLQFIPILDVINTVFLLHTSRKLKKSVTIEENAEAYNNKVD